MPESCKSEDSAKQKEQSKEREKERIIVLEEYSMRE